MLFVLHHKTCLYNFDPHKPHFYTVKLGFTGVYIIFFISAQKQRLWVLVRTACEAVLTSTHNLYFEQKYEKYQSFFLSENFPFLEVKFSIYLNRRVFIMFAFIEGPTPILKITKRTMQTVALHHTLYNFFISYVFFFFFYQYVVVIYPNVWPGS